MQRAFGPDVPESVAEMGRPGAAAVLVHDAQVGILAAVRDREGRTARTAAVLAAARGAGVPVSCVGHVSLPPSHLGVAALRTAMAWQRGDRADEVPASFPPDAAHTQLDPALAPADGEPVVDELGMSALVGTPLEAALRDRGVTTLVVVGAVREIGIEPTARHAADPGLLPVVVDDACGVVDEDAARRSLASPDHSLLGHRCSTADVVAAFGGAA
ncbi:isochorismatase family protein [Geodermatophilus sp. SYSU D01119]